MALSKIKMYPAAREIRSEYITARDQSMVESGVTKGGKNTASFHFRWWKQKQSTTRSGPQHKHEASS